jgi:NAD(P)-dependent dehydrogenase (short-subunit alcohol dehydrogenase family)
MGKLEGRVALVTGAGSGIGRASALAFAREGARVVVSDVQALAGDETVRLIREAGGEALLVQADVTSAADVKALVGKGIEAFGRLDCAHNNAGILGAYALTPDCTEENWDRTVAINLKGIFLSMKYEIPAMLQQGKGAIVNTSSGSGLVGTAGLPAYAASKHGVVGLTKSTALEYVRQGIRVNCVCPGITHTPMMDGFTKGDEQMMSRMKEANPSGRIGTPEEVADAVVWLCTDGAGFVTGHALAIDGGAVAK